jgi:SAM-dependent methyltransferase
MRAIAVLVLLAMAASDIAAQQQSTRPRPQPHGRLFPPQDLGLLEAPDRDLWQHPDRIMDALGIAEASVVADIGAGSGWFTIRLARRVGPNGIVYAEDVQTETLAANTRRVQSEGLTNVKPHLGELSDPHLPIATFDAILIVDAYHEFDDDKRVPFLKNLARSLKPDGRIGIVDFKLEGSGPGPPNEERVAPDVVVRDAANAGLRLRQQETFLPYQFFLIFELNATDRASRVQPKPKPPATLRSRRTP